MPVMGLFGSLHDHSLVRLQGYIRNCVRIGMFAPKIEPHALS